MGDSQAKGFGDQYVKKLTTELGKPAQVFNKSLFAGAGPGTRNAWAAGTDFATGLDANEGFGVGQREAMDGAAGLGAQFADLGTAYDPNSEAYQRLRSKVRNDTATGIYSDFNNSGLFGSDANLGAAGEGIADALAGLDYGNMTADINNRYRSLEGQRASFGDQFGMGQTALGNRQGAVDALGAIGAAQDVNAQGALMGEADLFDRTNDADLNRLIKVGGAFGDPVAASQEPPWWQSMLGYVAGNAGKALKFGG